MASDIRVATIEKESERAPLAKPGGIVVASPRSCAVCGAVLTRRPQQRCCSVRCRAALSRRKQTDQEERLRELVKVLAKEAGLTAEDFA